jgi:tubulin polyglutamylase TTLL11
VSVFFHLFIQVLGFDILILNNLKPILLEVNSNPSLSITSEQEVTPGVFEYLPSAKDEEVKRTLIRDTLIMMAPKNKYTRKRFVQ